MRTTEPIRAYLYSRNSEFKQMENHTNMICDDEIASDHFSFSHNVPLKTSFNNYFSNQDIDLTNDKQDVLTPCHTSLSGRNEPRAEKASQEQAKREESHVENEKSIGDDAEQFARRLHERTGLGVYADIVTRRRRFFRKKASSRSVNGTIQHSLFNSLTFLNQEPLKFYDYIMKVLDPWETPYYVCLTISSFAVLYNIFMIIARVTFDFLEKYQAIWLILDYLADLIYIFDIAYQARKGHLKDGILDTNYKSVLKRYFCSWRPVIDIASIFPTDLFVLMNYNKYTRTTLRLNRLLKSHRLVEWLDRSWRISRYPMITRVGTLVLYFIICLHWNACVYYEISQWIGLGNDTWVVNPYEFTNETVWVGLYLSSMYWSSMRFTNIGEVPAPVTDGEMIFTILDMLLAIAIFAGIFGNIEELLERAHEHRDSYHRWMDEVKKYMARNNVPYELQRKIHVWMIHFWNRTHMLGGGASSLAILPERLQAEINMNAHLDTLRRVKIFQDCEPGLLVALLNKLTLQMFNPGEYICRKGDVGKEMYIVKSGKLSVVGPDGMEVFATLTEGAVFGELALLNISGSKTGNRRTASIRSNGYSDLFCLSKEDLWDALQDYPDAKRIFIEKGREILLKDGLLEGCDGSDEFELLTQTAKYECVKEKADHLMVRMSAMIVGMGANLRSARNRIRYLEREIERYHEVYRRRKIQLADEHGYDIDDMKDSDDENEHAE